MEMEVPGPCGETGLSIDEQDKVTVFILPVNDEARGTIDVEALRDFGGDVIKTGRSVIKAKVPITLLETIADRVQGIGFMKRPDRPYAGVVSEGLA